MTLPRLLACALALGLALPAAAQAPLAPTSPETHADDAPDEGIHVSGEWTIIVREPDGTVANTSVFQNALTGDGAEMIARILSSYGTAGWYSITIRDDFDDFSTISPCTVDGSQTAPCFIVPTWLDVLPDNQNYFRNLQVSSVGSNIKLSGQFTVFSDDSSIQVVSTDLAECAPTVTPEVCRTTLGSPEQLTLKVLDVDDAVIGLESGQIVTVEVVLGFN